MTLVGFTALSVEISTIASAPVALAASATWRVPAALVAIPSSGLASTIGTCFRAAAWNTSSGRCSSKIALMRASSRMSAIRGAAVDLRVGLGEFEVDLPERVFAVVQQDQRAGAERGDLAGELGADGAPGAGDDDPPPLDQPGHAVAVERDLGTIQQVLDGDGAEFHRARLVGVGQGGRARGPDGPGGRSGRPGQRPGRGGRRSVRG